MGSQWQAAPNSGCGAVSRGRKGEGRATHQTSISADSMAGSSSLFTASVKTAARSSEGRRFTGDCRRTARSRLVSSDERSCIRPAIWASTVSIAARRRAMASGGGVGRRWPGRACIAETATAVGTATTTATAAGALGRVRRWCTTYKRSRADKRRLELDEARTRGAQHGAYSLQTERHA